MYFPLLYITVLYCVMNSVSKYLSGLDSFSLLCVFFFISAQSERKECITLVNPLILTKIRSKPVIVYVWSVTYTNIPIRQYHLVCDFSPLWLVTSKHDDVSCAI